MPEPCANDLPAGSRRRFLKQAALAGAALALPGWVPLDVRDQTVRVQGRVIAGNQGLGGVAVTDGRSIVDTGADGTFELAASARRPFVYLSVPAGYRVPQHDTGTAHFYRPLQSSAGGRKQVRFDLEPLPTSGGRHAFLVLADPQTQTEGDMRLFQQQTVRDVQETVRRLGDQPVFGVACGDITFDSPELYPEYEKAVRHMGVPFFQVLGNHDMDYDGVTDEASAQTFRGQFGPTYYSFDRGAVHYVVLDDVFWNHYDYFGYLDAGQLEWLKQDLARVEAGRPVIVFQHIPALSTQYRREGRGRPAPGASITNREVLYRILEPYEAHLMAGHTHEHEHVLEGGVHEHIHGTACAAWWVGPVCMDGTPGGYGVYEVEGEDLRWRYKSTGYPADHQIRLYPRGADPAAPDEFVANVWDWDPAWTVVWYEDGVRRGPMALRVGLDPQAVARYQGRDVPERHAWVEPIPTDHLFYAPVAPDAGRIEVEAIDRFGRTYRAVMDASS